MEQENKQLRDIVDDNPPLSLNKTSDDERDINSWDAEYERRCKENGDFIVCKKIYLNLKTPQQLTEKDMIDVFNRIHATKNPSSISKEEFYKLIKITNVELIDSIL